MSKVAIFSHKELFTNGKAFGPTLRLWEIAKALKKKKHKVTIFEPCRKSSKKVEGINFEPLNLKKLDDLEKRFDVAYIQIWSNDEKFLDKLANTPTIVDLYAPIVAEHAVFFQPTKDGINSFVDDVLVPSSRILLQGDMFVCANEEQKNYYLGMLSLIGRINPHSKSKNLIDIVPIGISTDDYKSSSSLIKGNVVDKSKKVILWPGGIFPWFDSDNALEAFKKVSKEIKDAVMVFVGSSNPKAPSALTIKGSRNAQRKAKDLGLLDKSVFFVDWVSADKRADMYKDVDLAVIVNTDSIENRLAYRTRIIDCIWGGVPVICSEGHSVSNWIADYKLGASVPSGDVNTLAQNMIDLLKNPKKLAQIRSNVKSFRSKELQWEDIISPIHSFCKKPEVDKTKRLISLFSIIDEKDKIIAGKKELIEKQEQRIMEKERIIRDVSHEKDKIISEKELIINEKERMLKNITHEKDKMIKEKERAINEKERMLKDVTHEKDKMIKEKERTINEKERMIKEFTNEKDKMIEEKERTINEKERMIFQVTHEKDKMIKEKERTINEKERTIENTSHEKDHIIKEKERAINEKERMIKQLSGEKENMLSEKERILEEKERIIKELTDSKNNISSRHKDALKEKERMIKELTDSKNNVTSKHKDSLEEKERMIKELTDSKNNISSRHKDALKEKERTVKDVSHEKNKMIEEKERAINEKERMIKQLSEEKENMLSEKERAIKEKERMIIELTDEKQNTLAQHKDALKEKERTIKDVSHEKDKMIEEKERAINEKERMIKELTDNKKNLISRHEDALKEKERTIKDVSHEKDKMIEEKERAINEKERMVQQLTEEKARLIKENDRAINDKDDRINSQAYQIKGFRHEIERLNGESIKLNDVIKEQESTLNNIFDSKAWKLIKGFDKLKFKKGD